MAEVARKTQEEVAAGDGTRRLLADDGRARIPEAMGEDWGLVAVDAFERLSSRRLAPDRLLQELPEAAEGESMPEIRGTEAGVWSLWEIGSSGPAGRRDCFALFQTDAGRTRPDLSESVWRTNALGCEVTSGPIVEPDLWSTLHQAAEQHGYGAVGGADGRAVPWLVLRLAVRVRA